MTVLREQVDAGAIDLSDIVDPGALGVEPMSPGTLLRQEWLEPLGITPYRLAKDIGVPPNRISAILAGARAITADTALRLAQYFGTDAISWMNLQARYDLSKTLRAHGQEIAGSVHPRAA